MIRRTRLFAERKRRAPSIRHEREPNTPLPIEGCRCDRCEDARDDLHGVKVGSLLGLDQDEQKVEGR